VIPIEVPPLRERAQDLVPLAESFVRHFNRELRKSVEGFEPETLELMKQYSWPGNVRELRNAIERAVLLTDGKLLSALDLPSEIRVQRGRAADHRGLMLPAGGLVLEELEKQMVVQALSRARGNRTRAAQLLGLNRDQIRYRIEKFHLEDKLPRDEE
jgi:DNA-binding NtrC family response regulator